MKSNWNNYFVIIFQKYYSIGLNGIILIGILGIYTFKKVIQICFSKFNWFQKETNINLEIIEKNKREFEKNYKDKGLFSYTENGFIIKIDGID